MRLYISAHLPSHPTVYKVLTRTHPTTHTFCFLTPANHDTIAAGSLPSLSASSKRQRPRLSYIRTVGSGWQVARRSPATDLQLTQYDLSSPLKPCSGVAAANPPSTTEVGRVRAADAQVGAVEGNVEVAVGKVVAAVGARLRRGQAAEASSSAPLTTIHRPHQSSGCALMAWLSSVAKATMVAEALERESRSGA